MSLVIDRGFKPDLAPYISGRPKILELFDRWGIVTVGTPIATEPDLRGALWHSTRRNRSSEGISLVVTVPRERRIYSAVPDGRYFFGVLTQRALENHEDPVEAYVEAACCPVLNSDGHESVLSLALAQLAEYAEPPIEKYC